MNKDFVNQAKYSEAIRSTTIKFFEGEESDKVKNMGILKFLKGWNKILHDKCNKN